MNILRLFSLINSINLFQLLLYSTFFLFFIWYARFHWRRKTMYKAADKVHGPPCYPIVGCALHFLGGTSVILDLITEGFKKYPILIKAWFGPFLTYCVSKPAHLEIILKVSFNKGPLWAFSESVVGHGLLTAPASKWKKNRKIISPTFNQKLLDSFVNCFSENGVLLVDQLKAYVNKGCTDIYPNVLACTTDIISETTFGVSINAQKTGRLEFAEWIDELLAIFYTRVFNIFYHSDFVFDRTNLAKTYKYYTAKLHDFSTKVVEKKRKEIDENVNNTTNRKEALIDENPKTKKALLDLIMELKFTNEEVMNEVNTIAIAGTDTAAVSLSFFFMALGINQGIQQKVYEEIIEVIGHDRPVTLEDLPKLKYLEQAIKEALRLFPPIPLITRAIEEDLNLGECVLPAGSYALICVLETHRNSLYWKNPLEFNPDRFSTEEMAKRHPYSFIPFGGGPRNCIAFKFATMAMKTLAATVLRTYKIKTPYQSIGEIKLKTITLLRPAESFKLFIENRIN